MAASRNKILSDLPAHVAAFLAARALPSTTFCIGLSGGRDSVVLLHALVTAGLVSRLSALHVHHGLSPHADGWATHCQHLCDSFGVPLQIQRVQVKDSEGLGLEAAARHARYACFETVSADCILLAHHQDDQAETVIFNLLRGSGVAGAKGMSAERRIGAKRGLRPLLDVPAAQLALYAAENRLQWVEDESNADTMFSRNYLRHEVMPQVLARFPAAIAQLGKAAEHFAEAEGLLGDLAAGDWQACAEGDVLLLISLRKLTPARIRNLLRWRLQTLGWQAPAMARLEELTRQLLAAGPEGRPELILPGGILQVRRGRLEFLAAA